MLPVCIWAGASRRHCRWVSEWQGFKGLDEDSKILCIKGEQQDLDCVPVSTRGPDNTQGHVLTLFTSLRLFV